MSQDGPFSRAQTLANQKCERKNVYELSLDQTRLRFGGHALLWGTFQAPRASCSKVG